MKAFPDIMALLKEVSRLFHITQTPHTPVFSESRDINTLLLRDMKGPSPERSNPPEGKITSLNNSPAPGSKVG